MHIALVTHHYTPEVGAPQRRWDAFVQRFTAAGHRVTVLAPSPHYPSGRADDLSPDLSSGAVTTGRHGETIYRLRWREHGPGLASRSVDQAVSAHHAITTAVAHLRASGHRPDVIIGTAPGLPSIPAALLIGAALRRPVIIEMRDAWPDLIAPSGMWGPDAQRSWKSTITRAAHNAITYMQRNAAAVVTTTATFGEVMAARGMRNVTVIRNGATLTSLPHLPAPADRNDNTVRVLYAGTLGRAQGLGVAVQAATLAHRAGLDIDLRIIGAGADGGILRNLALHTPARVDVIDRINPDEVLAQYAWADTTLVSLRAWDPFSWTVPSKTYELLSVGRHISAAVEGEAALIVRDARAGHVVTPEAPGELAALWQDVNRHRHLLDVGHGGRAWVAANANHDSLAAVYLDLLAGVA